MTNGGSSSEAAFSHQRTVRALRAQLEEKDLVRPIADKHNVFPGD